MKLYKNGTLCALLALSATAYAVDSATPAPAMPQEPMEKPYFDMNLFSVSYAWMKDINNGLSVDNLYGGTLMLGQSFGENSQYYHTWYAKTGYLFGKGSSITTLNTPTAYAASRCEQSIIPVTIGYTFNYKWLDQMSTYVGAQAGFHYSKTHKKAASIDTSDSSWSEEARQRTHTKFAPTLGLEVGATYKFNKRISWDLGVNFNTTLSINKEKTDPGSAEISTKTAFTTTFHTGILITF